MAASMYDNMSDEQIKNMMSMQGNFNFTKYHQITHF